MSSTYMQLKNNLNYLKLSQIGFSTLMTQNTYNQNAKTLHLIRVFCIFILSNFMRFNVVRCCIMCYNGYGGAAP